MNLNEIPWTPIVFVAGQAVLFAIWLINVGKKADATEKDIAALKIRLDTEMAEIKKENLELKKELREIRDILIQVKSATDLLMLGRIKTGQRDEQR